LLTAAEQLEFQAHINALAPLMAAASPLPRSQRFDFGNRLSRAYDANAMVLSPEAQAFIANHPPRAAYLALVTSDPLKYMRGKTLVQLMRFILARSGRHHHVDIRSVLETAWTQPNTLISGMALAIQGALDNY